MQVQTNSTTSVIAYSTRTTLAKLMETAGSIPGEIIAEIDKQGIQPAGSHIWVYEGADGNPDTVFTLRVTVPVASKGKNTDKFLFTDLPEFKYVNTVHKGPISEISGVYERFVGEIMAANLPLADTCREVYLNWDCENQANCVTEIQMGVQ